MKKLIFAVAFFFIITRSACAGNLNGHEYVDLGLPSGTLWATCNVGANSPEEYGDYFAWGETTPKSNYNWSNYKYGSASIQLTKYCTDSNYGKNGFTDNQTVLNAEDDIATVNWGNGWRMPTTDEIEELYNKCSSVWTTQNGKYGCLFTGPNGNALFLPAAGFYFFDKSLYNAGSYGYYWSSTLCDDHPCDAYYLCFRSDGVRWLYFNRGYGLSVRPVVSQSRIKASSNKNTTAIQKKPQATSSNKNTTAIQKKPQALSKPALTK